MTRLDRLVIACGLGLAACGKPPVARPAPRMLSFGELGDEWPTDVAEVPEHIQNLSGVRVEMVGFLCALGGNEALLVPSLRRSGCAVRLGPVGRIVRVVFPNSDLTRLSERVRVTGTFRVSATMLDGCCVDMFQLQADSCDIAK